jgi:hypothetical protein
LTQPLSFETPASPSQSGFETALNQIAAALRGLRFGSVEIVVHDSKVVQISRTEKFRPSDGR